MAERGGPRRRPGGAGTPAEHAVLGLLELDAGAGHGYDLARHLAPGQPLAAVFRLEPGMLYHHLKGLARAGWATATLEPQAARPPRRVYRITPAGRAELRRWLVEPVAHTRDLRLSFLVKLFFARSLDPALAAALVAAQRARTDSLAAALAAQLAVVHDPDADPGAHFARLVLDLRLAQTGAAADWLERLDADDAGTAAS